MDATNLKIEDVRRIGTRIFIGFAVVMILTVAGAIYAAKCHAQSSPIIIQPPAGLPSFGYTNPTSGALTIVPPVGGPTMVYPSQMPSSPVTVQPPVGLPTYIYGR